MKTLACITDETLGLIEESEGCPKKEREATRAIIFNDDGQVALIYTEKHGHHKLPGGGIEDGEDFKVAIEREAIEEAGCEIKVREEVIGKIEERRNRHNFKQTSYCGIADVIKDLGANQLTEDEISEGYTAPKWVTLQEALELFNTDQPKTYIGKHMHARDMMFVETAIGMSL